MNVKELKHRSRGLAEAPAVFLGRLGLTPNGLTIVGSLLTASVGLLVAQGWFVAAGICLWLFSATDTLDGALARATSRVTVFGAFLDSVCDRYAEAAVFFGIVFWYLFERHHRRLAGALKQYFAKPRSGLGAVPQARG